MKRLVKHIGGILFDRNCSSSIVLHEAKLAESIYGKARKVDNDANAILYATGKSCGLVLQCMTMSGGICMLEKELRGNRGQQLKPTPLPYHTYPFKGSLLKQSLVT